MGQGGYRLGVQSAERAALQRCGPAGHVLSHLDDSLQILAAPGGIDDGLGGVGDHSTEVVQVRDRRSHIGGDAHTHEKADVGQRIHQACDVDDVGQDGLPPLAAVGIDHKGRVGSGAIVAAIALQEHGGAALAIAEHDPLGRDADRPFDQVRGKAHALPIEPAAGPSQALPHVGYENAHARPTQDL